MTRPEKDWGGSIAVLYQLSATRVRAGEHVQDGTAFNAALNILQNDLKALPVYTHSHCRIWFTVGQTPKKQHLRSVTHCEGIHIHIVVC